MDEEDDGNTLNEQEEAGVDDGNILDEQDSVFDLSNRVDNVSSDALLDTSREESFHEFVPPSPGGVSTPMSNLRRSSRTRNVQNTNVVESSSTQRKNPRQSKSQAGRLKCPKCPNSFANKKTLDSHLRGHLMTGVTSRLPIASNLIQAMPVLFGAVIVDILKEEIVGDLDSKIHEYAQQLSVNLSDTTGTLEELYEFLGDCFYKILRKKKIVFPAGVKSNVLLGTNELLCSKSFRDNVKEKLLVLQDVSEDVLNVFVGVFIFNLSKKVLLHSLKSMRIVTEEEVEVRMRYSKDRIESEDFRQLVFHIGGAIVKGYLWKGEQYSDGSSAWASFVSVLKNNFVMTDNSSQCSESIRHFTEARDRGGLTYIYTRAFDFFLIMFDKIMQCECEDGSLPPDIIDKNVLSDEVILCLWDVLVENELSSDDALDLLMQMCTTAVRIVMKGIMKRRINDHLKKSYASIALRSRLASRDVS
ncbi:Undecaprenyl-diphosphatase [Frankliniella fusca]|uniref:Undecaprenyl-diphosphatase n=1 Tax=Frankliniella fusca TaxID=407009 RepID=A0AAE1HK14_9NEOP|nr:Undecaprenyl-diphosphatase [Frankliniella fusca]